MVCLLKTNHKPIRSVSTGKNKNQIQRRSVLVEKDEVYTPGYLKPPR
jgi:hypothetical protein